MALLHAILWVIPICAVSYGCYYIFYPHQTKSTEEDTHENVRSDWQ